jgi:hypothetical protein
MPRGKEYCPYENEFFPLDAFEIVDGTKIHETTPMHRATDGVLVKIDADGKLVELQSAPQPTPFIQI